MGVFSWAMVVLGRVFGIHGPQGVEISWNLFLASPSTICSVERGLPEKQTSFPSCYFWVYNYATRSLTAKIAPEKVTFPKGSSKGKYRKLTWHLKRDHFKGKIVF